MNIDIPAESLLEGDELALARTNQVLEAMTAEERVCRAMQKLPAQQGYHTYLLGGDNVRHGLCKDLGFSDADRKENIRRVGEVARLGADAGLIILAAFISPFRSDRRIVRDILPAGQFVEVFVDAPLDVCKQPDPKGLSEKAERGEIKMFTGIDSPYETPEAPEVHIDAEALTVAESVNRLLEFLYQSGVLKAGYAPISISA